MKTTYFATWLTSILLLQGCAHIPQNEEAPASVADVVKQIKDDLNLYQTYRSLNASAAPMGNCKAKVGFDINSVSVQLTTLVDEKSTGSASLKLPVGTSSIGLSQTNVAERAGTQTLTFPLFPHKDQKPEPLTEEQVLTRSSDARSYPITAALRKLREGLLLASQSADKTPYCLDLNNGDEKDSAATFAFGFTVSTSQTTGVPISFLIFSISGEHATERKAANTITVNFNAAKGSATLRYF